MKDMIGIRADANEHIAMGHVMRCLSIAMQLKKSGVPVLFILSDGYARELILDAGFSCEVLDNDYTKKEAELPLLLHLCETYSLKGILIDSYEVTPPYLESLQHRIPTAYIDDLHAFRYDVELLINYTPGTQETDYSLQQYTHTTFLLGSSYTPLRPEFAQGVRETVPDTGAVFITTGGTDPYDMVSRLLRQMEHSPLARHDKHVVLGKFYGREDQLRRQQETDSSLHIYRDIPHIRDIMMQCDMAVSAGGTTLCELAACGIPTVAFTMADNQFSGTTRLAEAGALIYAGDVRENEDTTAENIVSALVSLAENTAKRQKMAAVSHGLIDGNGAERIARALTEHLRTPR